MKIAICSSFLFLITATAVHAHPSGLAHAHPHTENISALAILSAVAVIGSIAWIALRKTHRVQKAKRSR